ncbi:MAG: DUF6036 family nucleotidyltransferase [Candidatus Moranbacteria bacterium]|nr:DUF6036 family nucleotidyltransferase [Candidatus Moranbacteria bacterium]
MNKQFWHSDITEKSFQALLDLNKHFDFILIGGWAVYLWTKKMKSKDIDIVVDFDQLGELQKKYNLEKNNRLRKYEIKMREFDVGIYLPHYSKIGFDLEKINDHTHNLEGFSVPEIEILLFLKIFAFKQRKNSAKGEKDKIDIISILSSVDMDWEKFSKICQQNNFPAGSELKTLLANTHKIEELGINNNQMAKLKKSLAEKI